METKTARWSELLAGRMVRGATGELRDELPELHAQLADVVAEVIVAARRAATEPLDDGAPSMTEHLAAAATRGALEELDRRWEAGQVPLHGLVQRLDSVLDTVEGMAESRRQHLIDPGRYARAAASEAVHGAATQLQRDRELVERFLSAFAPMTEDVARRVGRGLAEGLWYDSGDRAEALAERAGRGLVKGLLANGSASDSASRAAYAGSLAAVRGALDAFSERLKRPAVLLGAIVAATFLLARRR